MKRTTQGFLFFLLLAFSACTTYYTPSKIEWKDYRINNKAAADTAMLGLLKPYSDNINSTMNTVIAEISETLDKKQPEGPLGDVLVDAMHQMAQKKFNTKIDASFINFGGIRLTTLPKGNLTNGKVYELMPFDNVLVLQQLTGRQLKSFLDHISKRGGWPVAGLTYDIRNDKAENIKINGVPFSEQGTYTICNSDFVANGGDDCAMLRPIKQLNRNILMRDAFIEYFKDLNTQGKKITAPESNRVRKIEG